MQIEGKNPIKEALESSKAISKLFVSKTAKDLQPIVDKAKSKKIRINFCDRHELDKMSQTGRHQGLIAVCEDFQYASVEDIKALAKANNQPLFVIILDGIEDPHNLGSIMRVAECCGAHGIIIPARRSVDVNSTVLRVSAGAGSHILTAKVGNINDTIRELKQDFVNVYCADMDGEVIYDSHLNNDLALVIGGEGNGVKDLTRKLCDKAISIPQYGKVNSLNASVACGICCYEVARQRNKI